MKNKKLLAIILLSLSFCFVSGVGYGEVYVPGEPRTVRDLLADSFQESEYANELLWPLIKRMREDIGLLKLENALLNAKISYIMINPTTFTTVYFNYDSSGWSEEFFPEGVNTKGKIYVLLGDLRGDFSDRSGVALKEAFKIRLDIVYSFIRKFATDMDDDIVALFISKGGIPLGYFYQGEYHLWEE